VRVELKINGISDLKHNHYTTSSMPIAWQTNLFIRIASCHETECSSGGTILNSSSRWVSARMLAV